MVLPFEFQVFQIGFERWTVYDSLCINKLTSFFLHYDWSYELVREQLAQIYGQDASKYMFTNSET